MTIRSNTRIKKGGVLVGSADQLNLIEGSGVTITAATVSPRDVDVTIAATAGAGGAPTDADYLVGTANGDLSGEIVVGTTPGGELGNTWASPTVDATHSGSSHAATQAAAESTAATALAGHEADTTSIHGITDTAAIPPNTADYLVGTANAGLTAEIVVGTTPGGELGGTWGSPTVDATHSGSAHHTESHASRHATGGADAVTAQNIDAAPDTVDYLVGTASGDLTSEIVVGTSPGGELGGTWGSPTVDATHSGSAHHNQITPGTGLDLAGDTLDIDSSEFTALTAPQKFDDTVLVYDASAADDRKMAISNLFNPRDGLEFACDFLFLNALTGGENIGEFEAFLSGTGAAFALGTGDQSHPGVQNLTTGSTATGGGGAAMHSSALRLGGGKARMSACIKTSATLASDAQRYDIQVGFWDSGLGDSTDGVYLRYSNDINAGKWQLIAIANGSATTTDTGVTVDASTWYTLEVEVNADATSAEAFINGTSGGTVASNLPSAAGREVGGGVALWKSVGTTARTMDIDMVRLAIDFTTAR